MDTNQDDLKNKSSAQAASAKKSPPKKPAAKKPAVKKAAAKKPAAKKPAVKKAAAKKAAPNQTNSSQTSSKAGASSGVQNSNNIFDAFVDRLTETFASVEEVLTGGAEIAKEVIEELQENLEDARVRAHAKLVRAKIYGQTYYKEGKYYAKDKLSDAANWASDHPAVTSAVISALTTIALSLINRKRR